MKKREILKTNRLILRPFKLSDAKTVQQLSGKKEIANTTLNIPYPYPDGVAEKWISTHQQEFELGKSIHYAIILKKTKKLLGAVSLVITKKFNHAELGYWIDKNKWGKGFATEAAKALLEYAFNTRCLHKIFAKHITRNPASGKVMEKLGMKKEGLLKEHILKSATYENAAIYAILKNEWNSQAQKKK